LVGGVLLGVKKATARDNHSKVMQAGVLIVR
jgi:hypothetical protein